MKQSPYFSHDLYVHTDGACSPNPGVGGWAAVISHKDPTIWHYSISGAQYPATNNEMELMALLEALRFIDKMNWMPKVQVVTDSMYVCTGFDNLFKWSSNGWQTGNLTQVKNSHLWKQIHEFMVYMTYFPIDVEWCKGHADNILNGVADKLAVSERVAFAEHLGSIVEKGEVIEAKPGMPAGGWKLDTSEDLTEEDLLFSDSDKNPPESAHSVAKKIADGYESFNPKPYLGVDLASGKDHSFSLHAKGGKIVTHKSNFDMGDI